MSNDEADGVFCQTGRSALKEKKRVSVKILITYKMEREKSEAQSEEISKFPQ